MKFRDLFENEMSDQDFEKVTELKGMVASHDRKGTVFFSKDGKSLGTRRHPNKDEDAVHNWLGNMGFKKARESHLGVKYVRS